jgi:hypothetical protein
MTQVKRYPRGFAMQGESVHVQVVFERSSDGRESVQVAVASIARPDDRQVKMKPVKCADGYMLVAVQNLKAPKPREPDPEVAGQEIKGDLNGKCALLVQERFPGTLLERVIRMEGGFGCNADGIGRKVFGKYLHDGRDFAGRRDDFSRFATLQEIAQAQAKK